jgi:hypothetical protein
LHVHTPARTVKTHSPKTQKAPVKQALTQFLTGQNPVKTNSIGSLEIDNRGKTASISYRRSKQTNLNAILS